MTDRFAGDLVDLGRCETHRQHFVDRHHHAECADPIGNKIRPVFGRNNTLSKSAIAKSGDLACHLTARLLAGDDLDQLHITRRVEKLDAYEMPFEIFRERFGDSLDVYSAGV